MDPRHISLLQTPTAWIHRDCSSYDLWCISRGGRDHYSCLHHAMGYIDWWPKLHACHSSHWSYRRQRGDPRDYDDNFHLWHIRHCFTASMAFGATMLLYDRLLHGGFLAHYCVPVGHQEELYSTMAEARNTPSVLSYVGYRQGRIYYNYIGEACCCYERTMPIATILRIFGPG